MSPARGTTSGAGAARRLVLAAVLALAATAGAPVCQASDWTLVADRDVLAHLVVQGETSQLIVNGCPGARGCAEAQVRLQASRGGDPATICGFEAVKLRDRRIFADGFESRDTNAWTPALDPPDGLSRLYVPWQGCARQSVVLSSKSGEETIRLDALCAGRSAGRHDGPVKVRLADRTWAAVLPSPAAQVVVGTLSLTVRP